MNTGNFTKAAALFKMNIDNYPKSGNVYDSYGDLLAAEKDTANAIVNYKKALAMKENAYTKQKLNALEGKESFKLTQQELQKYAGVFDLDSVAVAITMQVKNDELWAAGSRPGRFSVGTCFPGYILRKKYEWLRSAFPGGRGQGSRFYICSAKWNF